MKRLILLATALIAAVCFGAGEITAQVTNLEFTNSYFEDNTNVTETAWTKKNINFIAYTADKKYRANVKINTDHIAGTYTKANCGDYDLYITELTGYNSYYATEATLVVTQEGNTITLVGDMQSENGNFHFTITYTKKEQIDVTIGSISIYDYSKPTYSVSAEGSDYSVNLSITSSAADGSLVDGEYAIGGYSSVTDKTFYSTVYLAAGSKVTVTNSTSWNGDPCVIITGVVTAENGQKYNLNLTSGLALPDYNLTLNDNNATVTCEFRANQRWTVEGSSENILLHMQMAKEDYAGTYDMKKWNFGYDNYVVVDNKEMELDDAHIVVTEQGDELVLTGWIMAKSNGKIYYVAVNMKAQKTAEPAAEGDVTTADIQKAFNNWTITSDWMWGGWILDGDDGLGNTIHLISGTYWESGDLPTGTYSVTNDWDTALRITPSTALEAGGGDDWGPLRAPANAKPNGSYIKDANGNFWFIYKGDVEVSYDSNGLNIALNCQNTAGKTVKADVSSVLVPTSINSISSNADGKVRKYINGSRIVIEKNGKTYGIDGK